MKVNWYFFIVGILSILFCFTHAWNGYALVLPQVNNADLDITIKTTSLYIWHIISIENFIFGILFLYMSFIRDKTKISLASAIIAIIISARWLVIFVSTIIMDSTHLKATLIDSVAIIIYVALIIFGIIQSRKVE